MRRLDIQVIEALKPEWVHYVLLKKEEKGTSYDFLL